jgi:hypothetical protein
MVQTALVKIGSVLKIDGGTVTVKTIHNGYVVAVDSKNRSKVYSFDRVESLF